ncbi:MAG: iron-containing alcohol dehydrogenase [Deltaproteobacteria bacterium]|nr:iron-containing alcohol dehydrogenase [Deltaproteobacteria bacterium]
MTKQALILAGGSGKRLDRPNRPKPLVEIGGKPLVFHLIESMISSGITKIKIVTGYKTEQVVREIKAHFITDCDIEFIHNTSWEDGIASSAYIGVKSFSEPFLMAMGDHVFDENLVKTMVRTEVTEGYVSLLVDSRNVENASEMSVRVKCNGHLITENGPNIRDYNGIDTGLFIVTPKTLESALETSWIEGKNPSLWAAMNVVADESRLISIPITGGEWNDIDNPVDIVHTEIRLRAARRLNSIKAPDLSEQKMPDGIYDFIAGEPQTTKMVLLRGFFRDPGVFEFIPRESASSPIFLFTDETVAPLYGNPLADNLKSMGYNVNTIVMPDGEGSKSLSSFVNLTEKVLSSGVDERSVFISVGGGVVCNVCGFIASTIYRGLKLIHLPTSLMAQCDAAISHKQAINGQSGKNMVGSYYSPEMVLVDVETLLTLDKRLIHDGLAEVIKHALGQEQSYVDYLMNYKGDYVRDLDFLENVVKHNIRLKCELSKDDPKELAEAMVLQYGHTLGHPIEHLSGYSLYHGESVAIGMVIAARVARILGACDEELVNLHIELISKFGLPTTVPPGIDVPEMLEALKFNKRYLTEGTRMALLEKVGVPWKVDGEYVIPVTNEVVIEAFRATMEGTLK